MVLKAGAGPRADCFGGMRMFPPGCCRAGGAPFSLLGTIYNKKPRHADWVTRLAATLAIGITLGSLDHPRLEASLSRSFSAVTVRNEPASTYANTLRVDTPSELTAVSPEDQCLRLCLRHSADGSLVISVLQCAECRRPPRNCASHLSPSRSQCVPDITRALRVLSLDKLFARRLMPRRPKMVARCSPAGMSRVASLLITNFLTTSSRMSHTQRTGRSCGGGTLWTTPSLAKLSLTVMSSFNGCISDGISLQESSFYME